MINSPLHVGVMGCGAQSNNHFRAIRELGAEKASVVAVCDLVEDRLEKAREVWPESRATKDFREMVALSDLDLVIVATLPNMHALMTLAALEAGAHVLCEKPFMMSVKEAEAVLDTAERVGRQVQVGTNMRYMPTSRYLHDLCSIRRSRKASLLQSMGVSPCPTLVGAPLPSRCLRRGRPGFYANPWLGSIRMGRELPQSCVGQCSNGTPLSGQAWTSRFSGDQRALRR